MKQRIHITGAAGSGTSTLARDLTEKLPHVQLDTDDFLWKNKYTEPRDKNERVEILKEEFKKQPNWILSGSLTDWGDPLIPYFDLVIYLWVPKEVRIEWLKNREFQRYGKEIYPGGKNHESFSTFLEWASKYDEAGLEIRSKQSHEQWMSNLNCPILRIEGDYSIEKRVNKCLDFINN